MQFVVNWFFLEVASALPVAAAALWQRVDHHEPQTKVMSGTAFAAVLSLAFVAWLLPWQRAELHEPQT